MTDEQRAVWARWIGSVFMPVNKRSYEVIVTKAHLLEGEEMPQCLLDFCAHVAGYEAILNSWDNGDYSVVGSLLDYPGAPYLDYIRETFVALKKRQQVLLRR